MTKSKQTQGSGKENNRVVLQKTVSPDGSYAEVITDRQNNRVEICEYDAQGDNVVRVYGVFEKIPEISDDSLVSYINKLNSKYK